jgi:predicted TIM-barrel fold metal-dependent hydrolase
MCPAGRDATVRLVPPPVPPLLLPRSSDEYAPVPWSGTQRLAVARVSAIASHNAPRLSLTERAYLHDRMGTAATLRAVDAAAGGGFYDLPADAETDAAAADAVFDGDGAAVVDVQTHLVRPSRITKGSARVLFGFLKMVDPDRWAGDVDPALLSGAEWAACVFGGSETAVALLTSTPGGVDDNVLTNDDIAAARDIVDRYAGTGRVLTHTIVHPNFGPAELDAMVDWSDWLRPAGWKVYTLFGAPSPGTSDGGWFLDDEEHGIPFLERVRALGPRIVCAHKGIAGPIADAAPASSSPRDIGPAAAAFPDLTFVVYHSGYDVDPTEEEAHDADPQRGVSRLVTSLADAGVPPGANVYAELGSTWFLMLRRPTEAAHVLGKLLLAVGEDRILWGTDSVWYGPPQSLIDAFRAFTIPERMQEEFGYPALTRAVKEKVLSANAIRLYGIDESTALAARRASPDWLPDARRELAARLA